MLIAKKYHLKRLAADIFHSGVNLAERYPEWITLMYSMAGGGEDLLDSFLDLASLGSTYKQKENRRAFLHATTVSSDDSLATFLKIAKGLGYNLDDYLTPEGWQDREEWIERRRRSVRSEEVGVRSGHLAAKKTYHKNRMTKNSSSKMNLIPNEYLAKCRSNDSAFVQSLVSSGILTPEQASAAADLYRLGAMKDGSVIYWQIDQQGQVRDGKVMLYGPDCHRIKTSGAQWMGWLMRYKLKGADGKPLLEGTWHATQCLFGEHLVSEELGVRSEELSPSPETSRSSANNSSLLTPNSSLSEAPNSSLSLVCLVEAEKSAVILSQLMPDKLWLASGGETQLTLDKLAVLKGRKIILYPDTDTDGATFAHWQQIANEARRHLGLDINVSNLLETHASVEQKERKIDLVDFLTESEELGVRSEELSPAPNSSRDVANNSSLLTPNSSRREDPLLAELIDTFDLIEVNS